MAQLFTYEINLIDYWLIIKKRRWYILASFALVFIIMSLTLRYQQPLYRASSSVKVTERKTLGGLLTESLVYTPGDPMESYAIQVKSYNVLLRAAKQLKLIEPKPTKDDIDNVIGMLSDKIHPQVVTNTNVISISVIDTVSKSASDVANAVADSYVEENLLEKNKQSRMAREFIENQLKETHAKLRDTEEALRALSEKGEVTGIAVPLQAKLVDLKTQKSDLLRKYTEQHPDVTKVKDQIRLVEEELKILPAKELEYARIKRENEINDGIYRNLKQKLEEARISEAEKTGDASVVTYATTPEEPMKTTRAMTFVLAAVLGAILSIAIILVLENIDTSIGTIEEVERFFKVSVLGIIPYLKSPHRKEGFLKGLFKFDNQQHHHRRQEFTESDVLQSQLLINYAANSPAVDAYKVLRTNIIMEVLNNQPKGKTILLTSAGVAEGKSITAANLSLAMIQEGLKTLLIDADLRRSTTHRIFGIEERSPGLSDLVLGTTNQKDAIKSFFELATGKLGLSNILKVVNIDLLYLLFSGSKVANSSEIFSLKEFDIILNQLKNTFDVIIFDSPPVLAVADTIMLAPKADAILLVYKVGKTSRKSALRAKAQLETVRSPIRGVILNCVSPEVEMVSDYYYYRSKYYYEEKEKVKK